VHSSVYLKITTPDKWNNRLTRLSCYYQRQEVLSSRKKRTEQLETILNDAKQMLEDHKLGKRLLEEVEVLKLEKKVEIFQRKVEQMLGVPDDLEIERILLREKIRNERLDERRQQQAGAYQQDMEEEL
jgi:hypothetical protein